MHRPPSASGSWWNSYVDSAQALAQEERPRRTTWGEPRHGPRNLVAQTKSTRSVLRPCTLVSGRSGSDQGATRAGATSRGPQSSGEDRAKCTSALSDIVWLPAWLEPPDRCRAPEDSSDLMASRLMGPPLDAGPVPQLPVVTSSAQISRTADSTSHASESSSKKMLARARCRAAANASGARRSSCTAATNRSGRS